MNAPATLPAHDLDAEAAVLSASVLVPGALDEVRLLLEPGDCYSTANQAILGAIYALSDASEDVGAVAIAVWLRTRGKLDVAGGSPYLAQVITCTPSIGDVRTHARTVRDLARQRRMASVCAMIAAEGGTGLEDVETWIQDAASRVFASVEHAGEEQTSEMISEILPSVFAEMMDRSRGSAKPAGVHCGWPGLNQRLNGWCDGMQYVIAARPGVGKTAFALNATTHIARQGQAVVFVSAEMPRHQLAQRLLSSTSDVSLTRIMNGSFIDRDLAKLTEAAEALRKMPIAIAYRPAASIAIIRSIVRREMNRLRRTHGPELKLGAIVVDYLQLLDGRRERGENREGEVARISRELTWMAGEFKCPLLSLSQLNRGGADGPPKLKDLRESGAIEQDAYAVIGLYRPDMASCSNDGRSDYRADVILLKNRNGPTGTIEMRYEGECVRFAEHSRSDEYWTD